ncbi:MAG: hypothetical protein ISS93_00260 [Candidatus Aenigmarchaeota archaeon]|nr:hypothetical protein [Candidatus Aenigmarchaeota archaeon]
MAVRGRKKPRFSRKKVFKKAKPKRKFFSRKRSFAPKKKKAPRKRPSLRLRKKPKELKARQEGKEIKKYHSELKTFLKGMKKREAPRETSKLMKIIPKKAKRIKTAVQAKAKAAIKPSQVKRATPTDLGKSIETNTDRLYNMINAKGRVSFKEISQIFKVDEDVVEEWAEILEEHKLVKVHYPTFGKAVMYKYDLEKSKKANTKGGKVDTKESKFSEKEKVVNKRSGLKKKWLFVGCAAAVLVIVLLLKGPGTVVPNFTTLLGETGAGMMPMILLIIIVLVLLFAVVRNIKKGRKGRIKVAKKKVKKRGRK